MDGIEPIRFLVILASTGCATEADAPITLSQLAPAYYLFKDFGAEVVLTTLAGEPPAFLDLKGKTSQDPAIHRFLQDRTARDELADTLFFEQIAVEDFDAAFCIGISGRIWDASQAGPPTFIASFLQRGKPVVIIPGRALDLTPLGAGNGLLIIGDAGDTPLVAAHALLRIVGERHGDARF
ncbi:transporter [Rhizobium wenxiniae]|uniref:transporter n=1 Tax=Rhizobium wenxiniae TaxID=1737357 RepID=UPI001C6F4C82|nr:transporter [Rhizobium wenxiniae]MBW9089487.1 transporter [Rhizobium wenxiniae]